MISYLQKKTTMMNKGALAMYITNDIRYIGVNDHEVDLFEGQYPVPNGIAYNSYVILDEKIAEKRRFCHDHYQRYPLHRRERPRCGPV